LEKIVLKHFRGQRPNKKETPTKAQVDKNLTWNKFLTVSAHHGRFLKETGSKKDKIIQKVIRHSCFVIIFNI